MLGWYVSIGSFISPMFWTIFGIGAYFLVLAIAEKLGRDMSLIGTISGIGISAGMLMYCLYVL